MWRPADPESSLTRASLLGSSVEKMVKEAPLRRCDAECEQKAVTNECDFGLLAELHAMSARMVELEESLKEMGESMKKFESHRQSHFDLRQRVLSHECEIRLGKSAEGRRCAD